MKGIKSNEKYYNDVKYDKPKFPYKKLDDFVKIFNLTEEQQEKLIKVKSGYEKEYPNFALRDFKASKEQQDKMIKYQNNDGGIDNKNGEIMNIIEKEIIPLNQIFYGPPGTGKTYHTISEAVKICANDFYKTNKDNYIELKKRYKELKEQGQIEFITFHQSYCYEEFVEGIKPFIDSDRDEEDNELGEEDVKYKLKDGIFKEICKRASAKSLLDISKLGKDYFYKMALGGNTNNSISKQCFDNDIIAMDDGIKNDNLYDAYKQDNNSLNEYKTSKNGLDIFCSLERFFKLKNDDIIVIRGKNLKSISAICKVKGEVEFEKKENNKKICDYRYTRRVEYLIKYDYENEANVVLYNINNFPRCTLTDVLPFSMHQNKNKNAIDSSKIIDNTSKNYVLIIDEINRGNISKILGELITLIEPSKRKGASEELEVKLPYSQELFSVPHNLYILGTMNTSDRSVVSLDTALRRRFAFREMMPDYNIIEEKYRTLLKTINERITILLDRDHQIGHSYFMGDVDLKDVFFNKIIPLLNEYFYNDFEKINLVLGGTDKKMCQFIKEINIPENLKNSEYKDNEKYYEFKKISEIEIINTDEIIGKTKEIDEENVNEK